MTPRTSAGYMTGGPSRWHIVTDAGAASILAAHAEYAEQCLMRLKQVVLCGCSPRQGRS
jgi:hypothetical protein